MKNPVQHGGMTQKQLAEVMESFRQDGSIVWNGEYRDGHKVWIARQFATPEMIAAHELQYPPKPEVGQ